MVLSKLLLVSWACLWGAGSGDPSFRDRLSPQVTHDSGDASFRDRLSPQVTHDHTQYQTPLSDDLESEEVRTFFLRYRWPNKIVPVKFDGTFSSKYKPMVYQAMDLLNTLTCVHFRNVSTAKTEYHLRISDAEEGCFAMLGYRKHHSGSNLLNLQNGCNGLSIVIHEIIHALGLDHQQVRVDRNHYVTILTHNIIENALSNFKEKNETGAYLWTMGLPYDFNSVMHYQLDAFNLGEKYTPTIKLKKPFSGTLGHKEGPSRTDIAMINRYYECWDHYLGDDIPDAVPYEEFHSRYIKKKQDKTGKEITRPETPVSDVFTKWLSFMKSLKPQ